MPPRAHLLNFSQMPVPNSCVGLLAHVNGIDYFTEIRSDSKGWDALSLINVSMTALKYLLIAQVLAIATTPLGLFHGSVSALPLCLSSLFTLKAFAITAFAQYILNCTFVVVAALPLFEYTVRIVCEGGMCFLPPEVRAIEEYNDTLATQINILDEGEEKRKLQDQATIVSNMLDSLKKEEGIRFVERSQYESYWYARKAIHDMNCKPQGLETPVTLLEYWGHYPIGLFGVEA